MISLLRRKHPITRPKARIWTAGIDALQVLSQRLQRYLLGIATGAAVVFPSALLVGQTWNDNKQQAPVAHENVMRQSPTFVPPVHIPPTGNPIRSSTAENVRPASPANSIPRQRSILVNVSNEEPATDGQSQLRRAVYDPFDEVEQQIQQYERMAQTPAPRDQQPAASNQLRNSPPQSVMQSPISNPGRGGATRLPSQQSIDFGNQWDSPHGHLPNSTNPQVPNRNSNYSRGEWSQDPGFLEGASSVKDCDKFRVALMGQTIQEITLDISPWRRDAIIDRQPSRNWMDVTGRLMVTGALVDMYRGYVVIESTEGRQVRIPYGRLSAADLVEIARVWKIPSECIVSNGEHPGRCWIPQTVTWYASNLCHNPLYFEDVNLERYGHSAGPLMQPLRSGAHFFGSLILLPYQTAIHPPNECIYALGYYRPGNCAPWLVDPFPISLAGAVRQTTATLGLVYIY